MKSIMNQAKQTVNLTGKLLDVTFGDGKLSDGRPYQRATVTIRVTQMVSGREETSEIPASFFATEFTSTGKPNPAWKSLQDLKQMKTAQNVGIEAASTVRVSGINLQENVFTTRNGQLIDGWQLRSSFINETKNPQTATFAIEIFIIGMDDEIVNDEPTGRLKIRGGIVQYNGRLDVIDFVVERPDSIEFIRNNWKVNDTLNVRGYIRVTASEVEVKSSGWGDDIPDTTTRTIRELVIGTGDDEGHDEDFAYDPTEIRKAFIARKAEIEQKQLSARPTQTKAQTPSKTDFDWE